MGQYIFQRNGIFYFRRRIPKKFTKYFPQTNEIRITLEKKSLKKAILDARKLNILFEELLMALQLDTFEKKEQLVSEYIELMKSAFKEAYFSSNPMLNKSNLEFERLQCEHSLNSNFSHLNSSVIEDVFRYADIDMQEIDKQTFKQIEKLYLHKKLDMLSEIIHIIDPKKDFASQTTVKEAIPPIPTISFKELYELFLKEQERTNPDMSSSRLRDYEAAYNDFLFVIEDAGSRDIASFTKEDFRTFVNALHDYLPKRRTIKPEFKNLSYSELKKIELTEKQKMAYETKKKRIEIISQILDVAVDDRYEYIEENLAKAFLLPNKANSQRIDRKPLSDDNLKKLFNSKLYTNPKIKNNSPHRYWIPLIALYTGMRENEICQLYVEDVQNITTNKGQTIWYFDINEEKDKHLKNKNAIRLMPLHPKLIELGFIEYYESIKDKQPRLWNDLRLHPKTKRYNTDYTKAVMKYFRQHVTKEEDQVFHSLRHNVGDQLIKNTVREKLPKMLVNALMGHKPDEDMTSKVYSQGFGVEELYEGIKTLRFDLL